MKFLTQYPLTFTRNALWSQAFPSLFIVITFIFVYKEVMHTVRNVKNWKFALILFILSTYVFLIYKFTIFLSINFCLISSHKRTNKHKLHLTSNTKSTLKEQTSWKHILLKMQMVWSFCFSFAWLSVLNLENYYHKMKFCLQLYTDIWEIILYLQAS